MRQIWSGFRRSDATGRAARWVENYVSSFVIGFRFLTATRRRCLVNVTARAASSITPSTPAPSTPGVDVVTRSLLTNRVI